MRKKLRTANLKLRPNVVCEILHSNGSNPKIVAATADIAKRLTYFELVKLREAGPYIWGGQYFQRENLTREQSAHLNAFLQTTEDQRSESACGKLQPIHVALKAFVDSKENLPAVPVSAETPTNRSASVRDAVKQQGTETEKETETEAAIESGDPQDYVRSAPVDQNMLVLAPPGTGKTHVLIDRLAELLDIGQFESPAEEILVLSFTRATVAEIRRRLRERVSEQTSDDLRYVGVRTFDSFATGTLVEELGEEHMHERLQQYKGSSFDRRIRLFTDVLTADSPSDSGIVSKVRYLVVDEIQDLVCARAAMVIAMINAVLENGGTILVLGDPAQAIYDYQRDTDACHERIGSREFLNTVRGILGKDHVEVEFSKFYRYSDVSISKFVGDARRAMGKDGNHPDREALLKLVYDLGEPEVLARLPARAKRDGAVAVLVRSNVQAYQIYDWCRNSKIPVHIHKGARGGNWPVWLAQVLMGWKQDTMSLDKFRRRWKEHLKKYQTTSLKEAEEVMTSMRGLIDGTVRLDRLRYVVSTEPPPVTPLPDGGIIVSTIHRSKGLEYDSVLVLEPDIHGQSASEEIRVLYVAATRAKKHLAILKRDSKFFRRARRVGNTDYFKLADTLFLTGSDDLDPDLLDPDLQRCGSIMELQTKILHMYESAPNGELPAYLCARDGVEGINFSLAIEVSKGNLDDVCWCGNDFSHALYGSRNRMKDLPGGNRGWAVNITGLHTVAFDIADDEASEIFGNASMALVPILDTKIKL